MYCVEGKICGFKVVKGRKSSEKFLICFDKSQVNEIGGKYFVQAVWKNAPDKGKDSIFALEVTKEQAPKEGEKYILEIGGIKDWLKNYIGKRITVKFDNAPAAKKGEASEVVFID